MRYEAKTHTERDILGWVAGLPSIDGGPLAEEWDISEDFSNEISDVDPFPGRSSKDWSNGVARVIELPDTAAGHWLAVYILGSITDEGCCIRQTEHGNHSPAYSAACDRIADALLANESVRRAWEQELRDDAIAMRRFSLNMSKGMGMVDALGDALGLEDVE
jgi:hypothetical protein